nr:immunoglobulin heavy chain junction region [Mus musculus]
CARAPFKDGSSVWYFDVW